LFVEGSHGRRDQKIVLMLVERITV
jgi:hypothetical protein